MTFVAYANTGPFTNNVQPPSLSATLFNNIESFLDQIVSSAVADANITANGSGALTAVSETLTGAGTGLTVSHNATVSGILTTTGNHVANGGMNINTIRDNVGGTTAIDLSAGGGLAKFPNGITLSGGTLNLRSGSLARIAFGFNAFTTGGTVITHGLGALPVILMLPSANVNCWASSTTTTTQFTGFVSSNTNCWWLCIA